MSTQFNRADLLARRAADYFKDGLCDTAGALRAELSGMDAFAVATQLDEAVASPDEVAATFEALKQILATSEGEAPDTRFDTAVQHALELVSRLLSTHNNIVLDGWLNECSPFIKSEADLSAFVTFFESVVRQYSALQLVKQPEADL
jgi:hypothetical protein